MPSSEYQVKTGDTLSAIARRFGVGVDVLARHNGLSDINRIFVGQMLKIPEPVTLQEQVAPQPKTYRVVAGDTLATIAQSNKVTVDSLRQANKLGESDEVVFGQLLVLPAEAPKKVESSPTKVSTSTTTTATTTTATTTATTTTTPKQNQGSGTLKDEDNLALGVNETYREALLAASRRTGLPPQCLAAIIEAEAAKEKKTKVWKADSQATTSSAAGLAQFLSGTWVGEACREGTALHEYARGHDLITEVLDKKGKRKGWEVKDSGSKTTLLALRLKPEMSIMAAAELALYSLAAIRKSFKVPDTVTRGDLARLAYLYHHEGATGGDRILRRKDTHTKEDLERQTGSTKAQEYLSAHKNDATVAYRAWLGEYIDKKINPVQFTTDPKQFPAPRPLLTIAKDLSPTAGASSSSYTEAPPLANVTTGKAVLRSGMKGPAVEQLQKELVRTGYLSSEDAKNGPGIYGPLTTSAVEAFQRSAKVTVASGYQGVVDKATWDALSKAKASSPGGTTGGGAVTGTAQGPDLKQIARNVHDAMDGMGTDEAKVYTNLAKLNHDATLITKFKSTYKLMYGVEVEADIRYDFSNWFGELDTALGYLKPGDGAKTQQKPQEKTQGKTQTTTPSLKATPDLQALLKELHVSIETFVNHENVYFAQLTKLLALKGIIKATPVLTRDTFREAVKSFQKSKKLAVTEGIPDENTIWELQVDWAKSRKLKLTQVTADIVKGYDGYNNFTLRADAVDAYNAFRKDVLAAGGVVTSAGSLRVLTAEVSAGRSSTSMHYSGLALDLATYSGMHNPKTDPYVITQDGEKWRIWCRSDKAPEKKLDAVVHSKKSTSIESVKVKAFDFTAVAEKHGFARIGPRSDFPGNYMSAEWWHLQYETGLTRYLSQFGAELLSLEKYDEATLKGHTSIWKNRQRVFKRGSNGWH